MNKTGVLLLGLAATGNAALYNQPSQPNNPTNYYKDVIVENPTDLQMVFSVGSTREGPCGYQGKAYVMAPHSTETFELTCTVGTPGAEVIHVAPIGLISYQKVIDSTQSHVSTLVTPVSGAAQTASFVVGSDGILVDAGGHILSTKTTGAAAPEAPAANPTNYYKDAIVENPTAYKMVFSVGSTFEGPCGYQAETYTMEPSSTETFELTCTEETAGGEVIHVAPIGLISYQRVATSSVPHPVSHLARLDTPVTGGPQTANFVVGNDGILSNTHVDEHHSNTATEVTARSDLYDQIKAKHEAITANTAAREILMKQFIANNNAVPTFGSIDDFKKFFEDFDAAQG